MQVWNWFGALMPPGGSWVCKTTLKTFFFVFLSAGFRDNLFYQLAVLLFFWLVEVSPWWTGGSSNHLQLFVFCFFLPALFQTVSTGSFPDGFKQAAVTKSLLYMSLITLYVITLFLCQILLKHKKLCCCQDLFSSSGFHPPVSIYSVFVVNYSGLVLCNN